MHSNRIAGLVIGDLFDNPLGKALGGYLVTLATAGATRPNAFPSFSGRLDDIVHQPAGPNTHTPHITGHIHGESGATAFCGATLCERECIAFDFVDSHMNLHPLKGIIN